MAETIDNPDLHELVQRWEDLLAEFLPDQQAFSQALEGNPDSDEFEDLQKRYDRKRIQLDRVGRRLMTFAERMGIDSGPIGRYLSDFWTGRCADATVVVERLKAISSANGYPAMCTQRQHEPPSAEIEGDNPSTTFKPTKDQCAILYVLFKSNARMIQCDIAAALTFRRLSEKTVRENLKVLREHGYCERLSPRKGDSITSKGRDFVMEFVEPIFDRLFTG